MLDRTGSSGDALVDKIHMLIGKANVVRAVWLKGGLINISVDCDSSSFWSQFGDALDREKIDRNLINIMGIEIG